jgi:putative addiction module component (TIGR02574 family)
MTVDTVRSEALRLPREDRAVLARDLLLSLDQGDFDDDAESSWASEIEARSAAIAAGNYSASDWQESLARLRDDLRQRRQG